VLVWGTAGAGCGGAAGDCSGCGKIEQRGVDLNGLLPLDHPARAVWAFVEQLDLSPLLEAIKAREGEPGHPPADPRIPMALWPYYNGASGPVGAWACRGASGLGGHRE